MMYYVGGGGTPRFPGQRRGRANAEISIVAAAALLGLWYFTRDPVRGPPLTRMGPELTGMQEVKGEMKRVATK